MNQSPYPALIAIHDYHQWSGFFLSFPLSTSKKDLSIDGGDWTLCSPMLSHPTRISTMDWHSMVAHFKSDLISVTHDGTPSTLLATKCSIFQHQILIYISMVQLKVPFVSLLLLYINTVKLLQIILLPLTLLISENLLQLSFYDCA